MKTIKISDEAPRKLTATPGMLIAQMGKLQTCNSTITALLTQSVRLPKENIMKVEHFIKENKYLGYATREEFIKDAIRFKLITLKNGKGYIEIPRRKYENLNRALKEMNMPYHSASDFIHKQINAMLESIAKWTRRFNNG
jgi:Arc/MetJ-type ribon-helix-helix transcriptional regulator